MLICTSNRVGPVYRFVNEEGRWQFDGLVGISALLGRNHASVRPAAPANGLRRQGSFSK